MASVKRDDSKQKWEDTEFPLVCETCLGDNPYVRMTKEPFGKKCQVCETPFTVFAWQAGTKGRLKRVEICRSCAQAKNVCQVCIYDLQYGLPVKVRDKILRETGSASTMGMAVPQSQANRSWYTAQQERLLEQGGNAANNPNTLAHAKLADMARMEPRYERNLPKLCSFFAKGECDRGAQCPFRHELPRDRNDPMSKQNTKDRFFGQSDPVAKKILGKQRRREQENTKNDNGDADGSDQARATLYLKLEGEPPFPNMTEPDIRDLFYAYGEIVSVRIPSPSDTKGQAFVEYTQPEAAELAIASMNRKAFLGRDMYVTWARAPKRGDASTEEAGPRGEVAALTMGTNIVAPPGSQNHTSATMAGPKLPPGLVVKPPPEVAAIAAARKQQAQSNDNTTTGTVPRPSSVPRPGGGVLRGAGVAAAKRVVAAPKKPYYPSADPARLGSK